MSRYIEQNPDGTLAETLADPDQCAWMFNEICCNDQSEHLADWPPEGYCEHCPFYAPEDMKE